MASIVSQLTNDGNKDRGIPGSPTITPTEAVESSSVATVVPESVPAQVSIGAGASESIGRKKRHQFMTAGDLAGKPNKGITRQQLDLSQFPKEIDENEKTSIQAEIFKPGGDFDQMLERRNREMMEDLEREDFAQDVANAAKKISGAGRQLPAGTNEVLAEAGAIASDDIDFEDEDFGIEEDDEGEDYMEDQETYDTSEAAVVDLDEDDGYTDEEETGTVEDMTDTWESDDTGEDLVEDEEEEPADELNYEEDNSGSNIGEAPVKNHSTPTDKKSVISDFGERFQEHETTAQTKTVNKSKKEEVSVDEYADDFGDAGYVEESIELEDPVDDTDVDDEEERELRMKYMKEAITEKLRPVSERLDISGFAVAKRGTKSKKKALNRPAGLAKWPLINTGIVVTTKAIAGSMMELVRSNIANDNIKAALKIMYDHIVSAKPMNFNAWAKTIDAEDFDHLFFSFYISAFKGVNYIPIDCRNKECPRKIFITDDIPFIKMVDFHEKKNKDLFNKIYKEEPQGSTTGDRVAYRVPLSDSIAVDLKRSTLYSEYIETSYLNDNFIKAHEDMINYMRNIDEIYTIEDGQLIPIDYKIDPNSEGRTIVNKAKAYAKAIRSLTSDEIGIMDAYIAKLNESTINITYRRPAATCTICGEDVPEEPMSAAALVFIRNQLGLMMII